MIIDGQAEFRSLLMHHVSTHWPDAIITDFDPIAGGHLPDEFSGAGNDVILLGSELGDRQGVDVVKRFKKNPNFPAVVYFGRKDEAGPVLNRGADGCFLREGFSHDALIVRLSDILVAQRRGSSTGSLFVGDKAAGIEPLIKGYRFIKKLGTSSHSSVYLAERKATGVKMVLKVLRQIPDVNEESIAAFDRFLQEYEMIAGIDHPNIVKIYDLGVADDHAHIAMEYFDAGDLSPKITTRTLIVHGTEDLMTPFEDSRIIASLMPNAVFRPFPGRGHLPGLVLRERQIEDRQRRGGLAERRQLSHAPWRGAA